MPKLFLYSQSKDISKLSWESLRQTRLPEQVTALVLHNSGKKGMVPFLEASFQNGFWVHLFVDREGNIWGDPKFLYYQLPAAPGIDGSAIHIAYEGSEDSLLNNGVQFDSLVSLIGQLAEELRIPKTNFDVIGKKGIFTHNQTKRRFGGFVDFSACGGETILKLILSKINGQYYEEDLWKDRFETGWVLKRENKKKLAESFSPTHGRGISKPNPIVISSLAKDELGYTPEMFRVKYTFRGMIQPSCIVLHYTAIPDYFQSLRTLEARNLTATIMVDKDGKAYQLVDSLEHRVAAATGTNDNCIQIEIIGKDTADLLSQKEQIESVKAVVVELSKRYKIPLTNQDVTSLQGIFSHTQAKKKWGGSIFLNAKDFDPGEEYMELILLSVGGKYYSENEWKDRSSSDWAILFRTFQP